MKQLTCRELGGACDEVITGDTAEEMAENSKNHGMLMMQQNDVAHLEALEKMQHMSPEDMNAFMADFQKRFEEAEEV